MTALPAFMISGEWWDGSNLVSANSWVGRVGGFTLAPIGGRTTTIATNAINSKKAMAFDQVWNGAGHNSLIAGDGNPIGATPTAYSQWMLVKTTIINGGPDTSSVAKIFYIGDGGDGLVGYTYQFMSSTVQPHEGGPFAPDATCPYFAEVFDINNNNYWDTSPLAVAVDPAGWCLVEVNVADIANDPAFYLNGISYGVDPDNDFTPISDLSMGRVAVGAFLKDSAPDWNAAGNFVGQVAHLGCTPFALTDPNRITLYNWLNSEYGLSLPGSGGGASVTGWTRNSMTLGLGL